MLSKESQGPYFHGGISPAAVEQLLTADKGLAKDGKFLFWSPANDLNSCVLSATFKGAVTHHKLQRTGVGAAYHVNGSVTETTTLVALEKYLRSKRKAIGWPLPLRKGVISK